MPNTSEGRLIPLATQVEIPINECFINLKLAEELFQPDASRPNQLAEINRSLQVWNAMKVEQESVPYTLPGLSGLPADNPWGRIFNLQMIGSTLSALNREVERLSAPLRPKLFLVERYSLTTLRTALGRGDAVASIPLSPGEEREIEITTYTRTYVDNTKNFTVLESHETAVSKAFNDAVATSNSQQSNQEAIDYRMQANFHGDASVTLGGGEANADLRVNGGSNTARQQFSNAVGHSVASQVDATAQSRVQSTEEGSVASGSEQSVKKVYKQKVKNPSQTMTVNVIFYQLVEQFTTFLSLVDVAVAFRTTDGAQDLTASLDELDGLLGKCIAGGHVAEVRDYLLKELQAVRDYKSNFRSIAEEVEVMAGRKVIRMVPDLKTKYDVLDDAGAIVTTLNVNGLLLSATSRNLPSRSSIVSDLALGSVSVPPER